MKNDFQQNLLKSMNEQIQRFSKDFTASINDQVNDFQKICEYFFKRFLKERFFDGKSFL